MDRCVFCAIAAGKAPASRIWEDDELIAFMDIHPWRPGHLLVIPRRHAQFVAELGDVAAGRLFAAGVRIAAAVRASGLPCDDVHFLVNDGPAANQTVPHLHLHVLPRRRGDLVRLAVSLLERPLAGLLPAAPRARLDDQAARIRAALTTACCGEAPPPGPAVPRRPRGSPC